MCDTTPLALNPRRPRLVKKWLNRRSQRRSFSREPFLTDYRRAVSQIAPDGAAAASAPAGEADQERDAEWAKLAGVQRGQRSDPCDRCARPSHHRRELLISAGGACRDPLPHPPQGDVVILTDACSGRGRFLRAAGSSPSSWPDRPASSLPTFPTSLPERAGERGSGRPRLPARLDSLTAGLQQ